MVEVIPKTQQLVRGNIGGLAVPSIRAPDPKLLGSGAETSAIAGAAGEFSKLFQALGETNDKAVAAAAFNKATDDFRDYERTRGPQTMTPAQLYAGGTSTDKHYQGVQVEFDKISSAASRDLSKNQQKHFTALNATRRRQQLDTTANYLATSQLKFNQGMAAVAIAGINESVTKYSVGIEQSTIGSYGPLFDSAMKQVAIQVNNAVALGASVKDGADALLAAQKTLAGSAVRGWFNKQEVSSHAIAVMDEGSLPGALQGLYDSLGTEGKIRLQRDILNAREKVISIKKAEREKEDERLEEVDRQARDDFYFNEDIEETERWQILESLGPSKYTSTAEKQAMREFMLQGARRADDQNDVSIMNTLILEGKVNTRAEMLSAMATGGPELRSLNISIKTLRGFEKTISQRKDANFKAAERHGLNIIGIVPESNSAYTPDLLNEAAQFQVRFGQWFKDNPSGDAWAQAKKIADGIAGAGDAGARALLPGLARQYRKAITSGDPKKMENARASLEFQMIKAGVLDPLRATEPGLDLLEELRRARQAGAK
jgi:hypothetical protein